jgi:hypothetical protein
VPQYPKNEHNMRPLTKGQEKALRSARPDGMIYNLPHSTARALRDRSLGEILAKDDHAPMRNGHRPISRQFPSVTFRLTAAGVREAARLMLAAGNPEGAAKVQVAPIPAGNK